MRLLPLVLALAAGCCPETHLVDDVFLIRNPDAETQALVDACRDTAHPDCVPLCQRVTGRSNPTFQHCELHADNAGYLQVHVGYEEQAAACL